MASILLKLLRILHLARRYIGRASALFIARLSEWLRTWRGPSRNTKPAESSFPGNGNGGLASGGPAVLRAVVAASNVPTSASQGSLRLQIDAERQPPTSPPSPAPATPPVGQPYGPYLHAGDFASRSSSNASSASSQSRASDRRSIITSREALHAPVGQPAELPRSSHHPFGRGPDPSRSGGRISRLSRSPSPVSHSNTTQQTYDLENIQTGVSTHGGEISQSDGPPSPADLLPSSNTQESQRTPFMRRKQKTTSLDVHIQNPSLESVVIASPTRLQPLTEEPTALSPTHSPTVPPPADRNEAASQHSSFAPSAYYLPEGRILQLIHSDQTPRYTKNVKIPREDKEYTVDPLTTIFPYLADSERSVQASHEKDSNPWKPATHPDGALYFYDIKRRLFTDTDMHDPIFREEMEAFYRTLRKILLEDQLTIPSKNYDLVLDIMHDGDTVKWSYYYACHENRCLFWLEPYDGSYMLSELYGVDCPALVKHRLEDLYWNHWSLFPVVFEGRTLPSQVCDELMGILAHGCMDIMTSDTSTLPYDDDKMQKMISLVEKAKDALAKDNEDQSKAHYTAMTTRLLSFFSHWRFLHFHGQRHARLLRDKTAYDEPKRQRSIFISLLSPLLFLAPEVHLREMEKLWTDDVIIESVWKGFMSRLLGEWNGLILWSAVMLAVSVTFLAVPGVTLYNLNVSNDGHQEVIFTSSSQIAAALSVEASIGSIVVGMFLVRHNRTKQEASPKDANKYLKQNCGNMIGLEPIAIVFSLPWALLMWSMVTFSVALLCFCFVTSNPGTRMIAGLTSGVMVALTVLCLRTAWGSSDALKVWIDGFLPSLVRALPYKLDRASHGQDGDGDVQSSTGAQGGNVVA